MHAWNQLGIEPHATVGVYIHGILAALHILDVIDIYPDCIHITCPDSLEHLAISCEKFDEGQFLEAGATAYGALNQFHAWGSCGTMCANTKHIIIYIMNIMCACQLI